MSEILGQCNCITMYEKNTLLTALNSSKIDAERMLRESQRGKIQTGEPPREFEEKISILIGDYINLKNRVDKTPICR